MKNMSCLNPILAVSIMKNADDKHVLKFIPRQEIEKLELKKLVYGSDEVFLLPCSRCSACREDYAKDWALRCTLEAKMHPFNYFLTLTYDNLHIDYGCKDDFTKFLKNLGYKLTGKPNRPLFFSCEERGELTNRLHFHCVLFLDHPIELYSPAKIGDFYHFKSELLEECWGKGFVDVAPFEFDCGRYVAKYATKQGKCSMSRNLARSYYLAHRQEIIDDDFKVYGDFAKKQYMNIPKCFVRWFIEDEASGIEKYKLSLKKIQRLAMLSEMHASGKTKEADYKREKILLYLKHHAYTKERNVL